MNTATTNNDSIAAENRRRNRLLAQPYSPATGCGCCGERTSVKTSGGETPRLPRTMLADPQWNTALTGVALERLRLRHDFEFWAWRCVKIKDKIMATDVPFVLNRAQRRLLAVFEKQRLAGEPIRVILLKSRQWGGSTLTQIYMAWLQIVHRRNWHSLICAHVKDTAAMIRAMYAKLLENYPPELWEEDGMPRFAPLPGTANTRTIAGRGCNVTIGTYEKPDASRGTDIVMAHLSEVAFWRKTLHNNPEAMVQAITAGIARVPLSFIVLESTANGVGSYFHRQWLRAVRGESSFAPVFVAWHEVDFNRLPVASPSAFHAALDVRGKALWQSGLTLEQIAWYQAKLLEAGEGSVAAEHPATPEEAFASTGASVFPTAQAEALRRGCRDAEPDAGGTVVWSAPRAGESYVVAVDVGGLSARSDYSVIAVVCASSELPEVCAQWRGHIDYDLLAAKAAGLARSYNDALLVIESNTPENLTARSGEPSVLLDMLGDTYPNFYHRASADGTSRRPGFHTNRRTKAAIIANLQSIVRDGAYIERDNRAIDEMLTYEQLPSGSWAARSGCHDDVLMTRAIALYVIARQPAAAEAPIDFAALAPAVIPPEDYSLL